MWPLAKRISWEKRGSNLERAAPVSGSDCREDALCGSRTASSRLWNYQQRGLKSYWWGFDNNLSISSHWITTKKEHCEEDQKRRESTVACRITVRLNRNRRFSEHSHLIDCTVMLLYVNYRNSGKKKPSTLNWIETIIEYNSLVRTCLKWK